MMDDMKPAETPSYGNEDAGKADLIRQLQQNGSIRGLLRRSGIPFELIAEKPYTFRRWLRETAVCSGCRSLKECRQPLKGYYKDLLYDGILTDALSPCRYRKEKNREEKHMSNYLVSDLPGHLNAVSFENLSYDKEESDYLKAVHKCMQASEKGQGIYLYGSMGSGKTYLAACACNRHAKLNEKVAFIHYPTFCARMARAAAGNEYESEVQRLMYARFLAIDDIGAENVTEWNRDAILLPLLNARYEDGLTTWFTSNEDMNSLKQHLMYTSRGKAEEIKAERIMERIRCMSEAVELSGKDRRTAGKHDTI